MGTEGQKEPERKSRFLTNAPIVIGCIGLLVGGLGGAVFTYWVNRPQSTILVYNPTTVVIANPTATDVIPNLACKIGDAPVSVLFSHVIEFTPSDGPYLESADIALSYPKDTKFFRISALAPSPLHQFKCNEAEADIICMATKLSSKTKAPYRLRLATNAPQPPTITVAAEDLELTDWNTFVGSSDRYFWSEIINTIMLSINSVLFFIFVVVTKKRLKRQSDADAALANKGGTAK